VTTLAGITDCPGSRTARRVSVNSTNPWDWPRRNGSLGRRPLRLHDPRGGHSHRRVTTPRACTMTDPIDAAGTSASFNFPFDLILSGPPSTSWKRERRHQDHDNTTSPYTVTTLTGSLGAGFADDPPQCPVQRTLRAAHFRYDPVRGRSNNSAIRKVNTYTRRRHLCRLARGTPVRQRYGRRRLLRYLSA
jgi:hypothetical protein